VALVINSEHKEW